jgi:hypothetical protein
MRWSITIIDSSARQLAVVGSWKRTERGIERRDHTEPTSDINRAYQTLMDFRKYRFPYILLVEETT